MPSTDQVIIKKSIANQKENQLVKGGGVFYGLIGFNAKVSAQYILFFDSATTPADGAVPDFMVIAQAASPFVLGFGELGYPFTNGLYVCNSSTQQTKTVGSDDCWFNGQFIKRTR